MPIRVFPEEDDIKYIAHELNIRGFVPVCGLSGFRSKTKDEKAIPPHVRSGGELGFVFQKGDFSVWIWTTWLPLARRVRENDCGWIVIEQNGRGVYFLPVHRTKNFINHLLIEAKIARCRIRNLPICAKCDKKMKIVQGRGLGSRYWSCGRCHATVPWDTMEFLAGLPEDARQHLSRRRAARKRWQKICREDGRPIRQAMLSRKAWKKIILPITGF